MMQVSYDLSIVDLDVPFTLSFSICATLNAYINLGVLCFFTWQTLLVAAPVIIMAVKLQVILYNPIFIHDLVSLSSYSHDLILLKYFNAEVLLGLLEGIDEDQWHYKISSR